MISKLQIIDRFQISKQPTLLLKLIENNLIISAESIIFHKKKHGFDYMFSHGACVPMVLVFHTNVELRSV